MSEELAKIIATASLQISAIIALCFLLYQARRMASDVVSNAEKIGGDGWKKLSAVQRATFNFYLVLALVLITAIRFLELIESQLYVALVIGILTGLGVKLSAELKKPGKTDNTGEREQNNQSENSK